LVRVGRVRVERAINEEYVASGTVGYLRTHLVHHPFNRGLAYWVERHNRYSTMEADALLAQRMAPIAFGALFGRDPVARRKALKQLAYRLPMRPSLVFVYWYLFRLGFLDGRAGYVFIRLRTTYELLIDLKVIELERRAGGAPI
jgi:hypothetical protein